MKISGFSFVKNAIILDYPIVEAIKSALPIVDEFVIACGDSEDETTDAIREIGDPKIKIIETIWNPDDYTHGKSNAVQTNIALDACTGDWCFYLQADEAVHEKHLTVIIEACKKYLDDEKVHGFLFSYLHFWGDYKHYHWTHSWYRREVRVIRNGIGIKSWQSAQGFRLNSQKINVVQIPAEIFHYGWVRSPLKMRKKMIALDTVHHGSREAKNRNEPDYIPFDYGLRNNLRVYTGTHPAVMKDRMESRDWDWIPESPAEFKHDKLKVRFLSWFEENIFKSRIGEYRNYEKLGYDRSLAQFLKK